MTIKPNVRDTYIAGTIVSRTPLVTFSGVNRDAPLGLMSVAPDILAERGGLHFLHHTWTLESGEAEWIATAVARAELLYPNSHFVMMAPNEIEAELYGGMGERCILGNGLCLTDERIWRPVPPQDEKRFDAVYVARLDRGKRHELASALESLQLIYGKSLDAADDGLERVRLLLPNAHFANHDAGSYRWFSHHQVAGRLAQSGVGLCLSAVEGFMRASMEYLLCGLPVVSTRSIGGRDRYFFGAYCRVVEDNADAVAAAVRELRSRQLDPWRIREHIGQIIAFERYNLLQTINGLIKRLLGVDTGLKDLGPLIGAPSNVSPTAQLRERVAQAFSGQAGGNAIPKRLSSMPFGGTAAGSGKLLRKKVRPSFVAIIATPRSGTHLLRSILEQEAYIDSVGEVFNHAMPTHTAKHFAHFFGREVEAEKNLELSRPFATMLLDRYFDRLKHEAGEERSVLVDVKDEALRILDWPAISLDESPRLMAHMIERDFHFIRVKRHNLLAQIASFELATQTGQWVRWVGASNSSLTPTQVHLNAATILQELQRREATEAVLDGWLLGRAPVATVYYEDLLNAEGTLSSQARRLLEPLLSETLQPRSRPRTEKVAPSLSQLLQNYEEIARALTGSQYQFMLS